MTEQAAINFPVSGHCDPQFTAVREAFAANFNEGLELGAGFAVYKDGKLVIDLIGGFSDRKTETPWKPDTIVPVFSSTKAIAAIVIAHLADQDKLGYNQAVSSFWPQFAANGKAAITIGDVLSHQAGLSGITDPNFTSADWYDWDKTCATLAAQKPIWELGSACGYHPVTYGYLAGEIAQRIDGRSLGTILREDFCEPLGIDFHIGLPKSEHDRCAYLGKPRQVPSLGEINPATKAAFMEKWSTSAGAGDITSWREMEIPSTNGHGTALALAKLMTVLIDGRIDGKVYLAEDILRDFKAARISGPNLVLPFDMTFGAGIMHNDPNYFYGPNIETVGHSGWGGSCLFADSKAGISAAYVMNSQSHHLLGDPRPVRLIKALYQCV
ncbi:MAG: serine hydrolase domain-containing protein [Robiginitomaculum sp.]